MGARERTVLVDLDGTMVDTAPDIVEAASRMVRALGAEPLPFKTVSGFIGNGVPMLVRRVLAASALAPLVDESRALNLFHRHYEETNGRFGHVFPGVAEGLSALREAGYRLGCVTNKPRGATAALLAMTGLAPYFEVVVAGDSIAQMKPHPEPLLHACREMGTDPALCVLVGDSGVDVAAARAANMPAYIVRYGYPGPDGHAGMQGAAFIDSLAEMPALLSAPITNGHGPTAMRFNQLTDFPAHQLAGQRVFIRADLNVPLDAAGGIADDTRIRAALDGIRFALDAGARVMVTSHLGRPAEGALLPRDSLSPVAGAISRHLGQPVRLVRDWVDGGFEVLPGELVVLENCRGNRGETSNDPALAKAMAALCDIYVNDAFGTAHRAEASTEGIAHHAAIACAGPLMAAELQALGAALASARRPLVAIVAGSKVSTKLAILEALADKVDQLIVGGGIANTFLLARGASIGKSLAEPELLEDARRIIAKMQARGAAVPLPTDVVCADRFGADAAAVTRAIADVGPDELILDIGPDSAAALAHMLATAGTIVWNGPVGVFEFAGFSHGTRVLAEAIADSQAYSIAGGGDTVAAINQFGIADRIDYISTAGGAFLEFLEGKALPAVEALRRRASR